MVVKLAPYGGTKSRIGTVDFHQANLMFFVGYTNCEHCNVRGKVLLKPEDAREFAKSMGVTKLSIKTRFVKRVLKWANDATIE
jgi:hypothetical protein